MKPRWKTQTWRTGIACIWSQAKWPSFQSILSEEDERLSEEIDGSNDSVATERIPYQRMVDFVDKMVAPADEQLFLALHGKGAFHHYKEMLHRIDAQ
ncbi:MAG TPA: hypothetical protein VNG51_07005 [Ktedonobacteraceae bacterium]|nr:hypothetical protein [Ktedonobacteraceae bacterium]